MNLDGYDDLVASAIGEDNGAGIVFYFPGSSGGVTATGAGFAKQSHLGSSDEAGSLFGFALGASFLTSLSFRQIEDAIGRPRASRYEDSPARIADRPMEKCPVS